MNPDTPLEEVATLLPTSAAQILTEQHVDVQLATLRQVRAAMVFWESNGYAFDPIELEGILVALVSSLAPLHDGLRQNSIDISLLKGQVMAAEIILGGLRKQPGGGS